MLRRLMPVVLGLAAVVLLGGCVVHGHGRGYGPGHARRVEQDRKPRHTAVYNVKQQSHPHAHYGKPVHTHSDGNQAHSHGRSPKAMKDKKRDHPPRHRGYHEQGDRGKHKGHDKDKRSDKRGRHGKDKD